MLIYKIIIEFDVPLILHQQVKEFIQKFLFYLILRLMNSSYPNILVKMAKGLNKVIKFQPIYCYEHNVFLNTWYFKRTYSVCYMKKCQFLDKNLFYFKFSERSNEFIQFSSVNVN